MPPPSKRHVDRRRKPARFKTYSEFSDWFNGFLKDNDLYD